jgi:phosphatidylglycerophosphatase A
VFRPGTVSPGGWGVVADDLAAGLAAALFQLLGLRLFG